WAGVLEREWLPFPTADLVVHFWRDGADPGRFEEVEGVNPYLALLDGRAARLEEDFQKVEHFLKLAYDPADQGRVYIFVYPTLERYEEASGCLICAANVGGFLSDLYDDVVDSIRSGEVSPIVVYLTLDSSDYVALHEFTHVLDFSLIRNSPPTFLLEGLATYTGYRLDQIPDEWELGLVEQFVRFRLEDHGIDLLRDYFTRGGYWQFTYNVGASFIRFLAERGGWERFLQFYADLRYPFDRERLDALFQKHYGAGLAELEAEWKGRFSQVEVTANARAAYEFKLDQILARYIFLRPLLADPIGAEELFETARTLIQGQFNEAAGAALRRYLNDLGNLLATRETVERALEYSGYLDGYVLGYHRDEPELIARWKHDLAQLFRLHNSGRYSDFAELYWQSVHSYVTWRPPPKDEVGGPQGGS
ncbi:MAG: hypothetical protein ACE5LD_06250, partial [Candidatus Bipolaricaulia bacterium]